MIMRVPKLIEDACLIGHEPIPGTPGIVLHVQLHHDRDRGWWDVAVRETVGEQRHAAHRFTEESEAREALARVYAEHDDRGTWEIKRYA